MAVTLYRKGSIERRHSENSSFLFDLGGHEIDLLFGLHRQIDCTFDQDIEMNRFLSLVEDCFPLREGFNRRV